MTPHSPTPPDNFVLYVIGGGLMVFGGILALEYFFHPRRFKAGGPGTDFSRKD